MMTRSRLIHLAVLLFICIASQTVAADNEMQTFKGCSLVVTDWADGDSFLVRFPDGVERTLRLYGADCIEWHVTDQSDARRLRSQRRYFGISNHGGEPRTSIIAAKGFGEKAGLAVRKALKEKFSVTTAFADARGDGKYKRIYGFVTLADGRDLAEMLVGSGLARAFGVYREIPGVQTSDEYRERLNDFELRAAKLGSGAWQLTDWKALPEERKEERDDSAELEAATDSKSQLPPNSVNPNTAARDKLMQLPGIGEKTANLIIEGRATGSYKKPEDLARIPGIGPKTIKKIRAYLDLAS